MMTALVRALVVAILTSKFLPNLFDFCFYYTGVLLSNALSVAAVSMQDRRRGLHNMFT